MNKQLSPKQTKLLRCIKSRIASERDPSYRELANLMKMKSINSVSVMLKILERKGYVRLTPFAARSIEVIG